MRLRLLVVGALAACSGSSDEPQVAGGDFVALRTEPTSGSHIFLNDPIGVDFSNEVDLESADLTTMTFQAVDQLGKATAELVSGTFLLGRAAGDDAVGRRLRFVPRTASNDDYSNGGFLPGRTYLVQLVAGAARNGTVLRDRTGRGIERPFTFSFTTVDGTQPAELYRNPRGGGPRFERIEIGVAPSLDRVPLNLFGAPPVEVRLHFDQALNPASTNVPVAFDSNPLVRLESDRGRVFLEYKDPVLDVATDPSDFTWIPTDVELERNDLTGATVVLRPVGVLPNNATIRVVVESTLEDISGESNVANLAHDAVVATFHTNSGYAPRFNGIVEDFVDGDGIDFGAVFPESQAIAQPGLIKAGFAFEGNPTSLEYEPTATEIVLSTDFTQVVPKNGLPFSVSGGVFNFRNVTIPQGVTVTGQGSRPMVWLCSGDFRVHGTLSVSGGDGARVDTLNSANVAKAGGVGVCGGGNGGDGTPSATQRDVAGATGNGPLQVPDQGGGGGLNACNLGGCFNLPGNGGGSGGGGGTLATQGDPGYRGTLGTGGTSFQQVAGIGGAGCSGASGAPTRQLAGGAAGPKVFVDARIDNDFWGSAIDIHDNLRITGELSVPVGGGGGGGGGDAVPGNGTCTAPNPINDHSGGGGGGGGGILIVKALGEIEITRTGRIVADGGHGGGGEQVGSCGHGGGGGGGSGGMVVLMSAKRIVLHSHGSPTANRWHYGHNQNDYDFSVSADGGVCKTGSFGPLLITGKYPAAGAAMLAGTSYDGRPLGGLGGMGIVQLMVPPGPNGAADGTNTLLDDNIVVMRADTSGNTFVLSGLEKRRTLAWRGFANGAGQLVDDDGVPTGIGKDEGDIRPSPILLPVPFGAKSRLRSKWIDTGRSQRRPLVAADDLPRGVLGEAGPSYSFAGLDTTNALPGYVAYEPVGTNGVAILQPIVVGPVAITAATAVGFDHQFTIAAPALGQDDRYAQYEAELLDDVDSALGSFRIVTHTANSLVVDGSTGVVPDGATRLRVRAKFFKIVTNGAEGLGPVHVPPGGQASPRANVRIGFAFHQDPAAATGRFPADPQEFVHDLEEPAFLGWIAANGAPRYVQWDVTFDLTYSADGISPLSLSPDAPRPELHFLRLPFRF